MWYIYIYWNSLHMYNSTLAVCFGDQQHWKWIYICFSFSFSFLMGYDKSVCKVSTNLPSSKQPTKKQKQNKQKTVVLHDKMMMMMMKKQTNKTIKFCEMTLLVVWNGIIAAAARGLHLNVSSWCSFLSLSFVHICRPL